MIKIEKHYEDQLECVERVLSAILVLSGEKLAQKEIELLTYLTVKGTISNVTGRNEFLKIYNTTENTMNNVLGTLKKKGLVHKVSGKVISKINLPEVFFKESTRSIKLGIYAE